MTMTDELRIGALLACSLVDWPGRISAVVFTQGCGWRCPWCHNPELVDPKRFLEPLPAADIVAFLERRREQLDGVVVTGGEPLLQRALPDFLAQVQALGLEVKLDTSGAFPQRLAYVLGEGLVDFVALDFKATNRRLSGVVGVRQKGHPVGDTLRVLRRADVGFEVRVTVVPGVQREEDWRELEDLLRPGERLAFQPFRVSRPLLAPFWEERQPATEEDLQPLADRFRARGLLPVVRA